MKKISFLLFISFFLLVSCHQETAKTEKETTETKQPLAEKAVVKKTMADAATILSKKEVPILCYHQIRDIRANDSDNMKTYSVTPAAFAEQMKALSDNGYQTILPEQLQEYLLYDAPLPAKPVMITFDDTVEEQYSLGATEMNKYGFKGVYFIMTVSLNRPRYMSKDQIKSLSDSGHVIAAHTWDHHMVTKYAGEDWDTQLAKPKKKLEEITGKPVQYFAYPFGLWNKAAIPELKSKGYQLGFILSTKRDSIDPLYTIRRMIVAGQWSTPGMMKSIESTFNKKM